MRRDRGARRFLLWQPSEPMKPLPGLKLFFLLFLLPLASASVLVGTRPSILGLWGLLGRLGACGLELGSTGLGRAVINLHLHSDSDSHPSSSPSSSSSTALHFPPPSISFSLSHALCPFHPLWACSSSLLLTSHPHPVSSPPSIRRLHDTLRPDTITTSHVAPSPNAFGTASGNGPSVDLLAESLQRRQLQLELQLRLGSRTDVPRCIRRDAFIANSIDIDFEFAPGLPLASESAALSSAAPAQSQCRRLPHPPGRAVQEIQRGGTRPWRGNTRHCQTGAHHSLGCLAPRLRACPQGPGDHCQGAKRHHITAWELDATAISRQWLHHSLSG